MEKIATLKEKWLKNEIDKLIESGKSKALIALELGILPQQLNNILNGKGGISDKFLDKFIERFEINEIYLSSKRNVSSLANNREICSRILSIINQEGLTLSEFEKSHNIIRGTFDNIKYDQDEIIKKWVNLVLEAYPDYSPEWICNGVEPMKRGNCQDFSLRTDRYIISQEIPLYNFDAAAGLVAIFNHHQIEPTDYIRIPNIPPVDGALYVKGESMSPLIKNGDIVMFKKKEVNIDSILWGEIYILSFINDGDSYTAVKYIRKSDQPDHIRLESFNPDFAPKDIHMSSITALAIVKASLTFHTME